MAFSNKLLTVVAAMAKGSAKKNVNSTCMNFLYQPKVPAAVRDALKK